MRRRSSATSLPPLLLVPELPLDGSELLAQIVLALLLGQPLLGLGGDLPAQLAHRKLALQQVDEPAELGSRRGPARAAPAAPPRRAGPPTRRSRPRDGDRRASPPPSPARRAAPPRPPRAGGRRPPRRAGALRPPSSSSVCSFAHLDPRHQIRLRADEVEQPDPLDALDHQAHGAVRRPVSWWIIAHRADAVEILGRRRFALGIALRHEGQQPVAAHDVVDEPDGARLPHRERHRRRGEHDRVPERQDRAARRE